MSRTQRKVGCQNIPAISNRRCPAPTASPASQPGVAGCAPGAGASASRVGCGDRARAPSSWARSKPRRRRCRGTHARRGEAPGACGERRRQPSARSRRGERTAERAGRGTCPISTEVWTRRVHFVREGGGGEGGGGGLQGRGVGRRASAPSKAPPCIAHARSPVPRGRWAAAVIHGRSSGELGPRNRAAKGLRPRAAGAARTVCAIASVVVQSEESRGGETIPRRSPRIAKDWRGVDAACRATLHTAACSW